MNWTTLKHLLYAAACAGIIVFLQTLELDAGNAYDHEVWWPIAGAVFTYLIQRVKHAEGSTP